jgi:predicted ATPase
MLKRIYVDNYKSLVNFEQKLGPINLFLGPNGSGKSTLFEVISKIRSLLIGKSTVGDEFPLSSRTRWMKSFKQTFELDLENEGKIFKYRLVLEYNEKEKIVQIQKEKIDLNNEPLLDVEKGIVNLFQKVNIFRNEPLEIKTFPFFTDRSYVSSGFPDDPRISLPSFIELVRNILVVQINPREMQGTSIKEEPFPSHGLENFASWYRFLSHDQGWVIEITNDLKKVLPGFEYFKFIETGEEVRSLRVCFSGSSRPQTEYRLEELSDGEKALIGLYTFLAVARKNKTVLCIDEPENYLALPEIQPWLINLYDLCSDDKAQGLIISHHPEMINYLLASPVGYWFERQENQATRVKPITAEKNGGLPISELIARGWLNG